MKTKKEPIKYSIIEKVKFKFLHVENAQSAAWALASAGYFVSIGRELSHYVVHVYTDRE